MDDSTTLLITLGAMLLVGLLADFLGRETRLPTVTLLLLLGVAAGPTLFDVVPDQREEWYPVVTNVALVMIGFLLGGQFTGQELRAHGRQVFSIALVQSLATAIVVFGVLALAGVDVAVALLLGGIATATAPAATAAVVQSTKAQGQFPRTLLGVVALDDVWGLLFYSVFAAVAAVVIGNGGSGELAVEAVQEICGGVLLGVALAVPMALLSGRIRPGEPTREEAIGAVLLCAGLASWLDVSGLLAAVVMGVGVANMARHHERTFREIENIEWPFLVLFFVMSGAALETEAISGAGLVVVGYIVLRVIGKLGGAWLGGTVSGADAPTRRWLGLALLPQAGVALGLALDASERFPALADDVLPVVIVATVFFEVTGTLLTQFVLGRVARIEVASPAGGDR